MISMTGYAFRELHTQTARASVEIKSYNNRFLDLICNLPPPLSPLEPLFRERMADVCRRGHVEVTVSYRSLQSVGAWMVDEAAVRNCEAAFRRIASLAHLNEPLRLDHFLQVGGIILPAAPASLEAAKALLFPLLEAALADFVSLRQKEGAATQADVVAKLADAEAAIEHIADSAAGLEQLLQDQLIRRFHDLLGEETDMQRVYSEVAVYLVKATINEELKRLASHLSLFKETLQSIRPVGKPLDFIVQEMNREINTIGSKNMSAEISPWVVRVKDLLEQIREQLKNVE